MPTIAIALLLFVPPLPLFRQTTASSVKIGSHEVAIGASTDATIADLKKDFVLIELKYNPPKNFTRWAVILTEGGKEKDVPAVLFALGPRIVGVSLENHTPSVQQVFDSLYTLIAKIPEEDKNSCKPETWNNYVGDTISSVTGIHFECGPLFGFRFVRTAFRSGEIFFSVYEDLGVTD